MTIAAGIFAQTSDKRYWNWYFGNQAAIQFVSPTLPPVSVTGSLMSANEGASAISDTAGNLLFYTNGQSVWNNLNQVLPNGSNLKGHYWSAQSGLIVQMPGSDSLFYLFTVNDWTENNTELNYSIIDKSLNGGLGAVTAQKNILINDNCREHLTASYHANGTDIWILSHEADNNHFVAYLLSSQGLDTIPVVSSAGAVYDGANRYGYMRVSPYCNKIATALGKQTQMNIPDTTAQVFDFDNATGLVSNPIFIADLSNMESAYCCEFSPDNTKVYFTEFNSSAIYQVDLNDPNPASTLINISTTISGSNASLTLGPDDKIYVTKSFSGNLGVINSPNLQGSQSDHIDNAITYASGTNSISTCNIVKRCTQFTGVEDLVNNENSLLIFPNPSSGEINLSRNIIGSEIMIYDITGRIVYQNNSLQSITLDLEFLSSGYFVINILKGDISYRGKLILK